jgi:two-component system, OmpR family, osmolarity sensor histidine kinase EnvZ
MQARIAALVKGRAILLGAVSHDLKTYITRLRLRVEDVPDDTARDKAARDLDDMTRLIDSSIDLARASASIGDKRALDVGVLLSKDASNREEPRLRLLANDTALPVLGDDVALGRLFGNLIDNALRYGRHAEVSAHVIADRIIVHVDDGPGIPAAERFAVLEPFHRLEGSRNRDTGGSGLGLAIANQVAGAHDGTLTISQSPMGGARVIVSLPRHVPSTDCPGPRRKPPR